MNTVAKSYEIVEGNNQSKSNDLDGFLLLSLSSDRDVERQTNEIIDFIYKHPQDVVRLLQKFGFNIDVETATFNQIYELTFNELTIKRNQDFAKELESLILNEGYLNIAPVFVMAGASLVSSTLGGLFGNRQAKKQRELAFQLKMAELATNEKISYEQIKTQAETDRIRIITNSLKEYRQNLQEQSTVRLRDTWIYVVGLGVSLGILYGFTLVVSKD